LHDALVLLFFSYTTIPMEFTPEVLNAYAILARYTNVHPILPPPPVPVPATANDKIPRPNRKFIRIDLELGIDSPLYISIRVSHISALSATSI
jgi:hypothetical protein